MPAKAVILLIIMINIIPSTSHAHIVNGNEWYTYERMEEDLRGLKRIYRQDMKIVSIGKTEWGKNIWAVKLGKGESSIIILGGHHGREWLTSSLVMSKLEHYLDAYSNHENLFGYNTSILNEVSIWFIPMVNPDGIRIQQEGIDFLPEHKQKELLLMNENNNDFDRWKANGKGVDLNRQYPAGWAAIRKRQSPSYQFYKGEFPLEARETRAIVSFTRKQAPLMAVTYHSSGRVLYWKFNKNKTALERDLAIAKKLSDITGYKLDYPQEHAVGGGFSDWFATEFDKPSFTPEISYPVEDTNPPLSVFREEWERNKKVGLFLATEAKRRFLRKEINGQKEE
ncbi:M14 family zinc carboxypeptidase [Sutcliffiella deserti]|uniref:M14 family zinc carboxypeptidase n=1 Tax=Sutcliffiella deserti TaxID=2875501 RepID=UPI001CBFA0EA|nr:M14 family zinc carboxypeptidase [Sutcliffiella deserti]